MRFLKEGAVAANSLGLLFAAVVKKLAANFIVVAGLLATLLARFSGAFAVPFPKILKKFPDPSASIVLS